MGIERIQGTYNLSAADTPPVLGVPVVLYQKQVFH
jgi:hypothetical protein